MLALGDSRLINAWIASGKAMFMGQAPSGARFRRLNEDPICSASHQASR